MKFTELPDTLPYPSVLRSKMSTTHSDIISWVVTHYQGTYSERRKIVALMNSISYLYMSGDSFPKGWDIENPLIDPPEVDDDVCKKYLGNIYIVEKHVDWDIDIHTPEEVNKVESKSDINVEKTTVTTDTKHITPKEDLYIQSPKIPQFDKKSKWISEIVGGDEFVIYESLPKIPTKQNEISVTTNVDNMLSSDLLNLFPNNFIPTRATCMYEDVKGIKRHPDLGLLIPILDFSEEEIQNNIVEYPHLYRLSKVVDGEITNFYSSIEIDGKLYSTSDVWKDIPECKNIPYTPDFVKEYVTRRYLLERDIKHIKHEYPMYGELIPFLTLFMPKEKYIELGYSEIEDIAKKCVESRVHYKQSRNPVIRRLRDNA